MASIPSQAADYGISSSPTFPEAPRNNIDIYNMGPIDLANHFLDTIHRQRGKTLVKQDLKRVPMDVGLASNLDQLVIYNPQKNCLYKYRVEEVPNEIVQKLKGLESAQDFGVGCFNQLCEALKKAIQDNSISEDPEEEFGKGVEGAVAMLAELSLQVCSHVKPEYTMPNNANNAKVHVVLIRGLGESHKYSHSLDPNANLQAFLEEMNQKFPNNCDPYSDVAYKDWDARVQSLKKSGLDGDPALTRIEGLIALHRATENKELPQWMYYTILEGGDGEELDIKDEESFKAMMDKAAKKESPTACLMRIREAKFQNIYVELRFLEEKQLALARSREGIRMQAEEDRQDGTQQPGEGMLENDNSGGGDPPFFDPEPFEYHARLNFFYNLDHDNPRYFGSQQHDG